jgi:hypothetical protein
LPQIPVQEQVQEQAPVQEQQAPVQNQPGLASDDPIELEFDIE